MNNDDERRKALFSNHLHKYTVLSRWDYSNKKQGLDAPHTENETESVLVVVVEWEISQVRVLSRLRAFKPFTTNTNNNRTGDRLTRHRRARPSDPTSALCRFERQFALEVPNVSSTALGIASDVSTSEGIQWNQQVLKKIVKASVFWMC